MSKIHQSVIIKLIILLSDYVHIYKYIIVFLNNGSHIDFSTFKALFVYWITSYSGRSYSLSVNPEAGIKSQIRCSSPLMFESFHTSRVKIGDLRALGGTQQKGMYL